MRVSVIHFLVCPFAHLVVSATVEGMVGFVRLYKEDPVKASVRPLNVNQRLYLKFK